MVHGLARFERLLEESFFGVSVDNLIRSDPCEIRHEWQGPNGSFKHIQVSLEKSEKEIREVPHSLP